MYDTDSVANEVFVIAGGVVQLSSPDSNAGFQVILNMGAVRGLGSKEGQEKFIEMLKEKYGILVVDSYNDIEVIE